MNRRQFLGTTSLALVPSLIKEATSKPTLPVLKFNKKTGQPTNYREVMYGVPFEQIHYLQVMYGVPFRQPDCWKREKDVLLAEHDCLDLPMWREGWTCRPPLDNFARVWGKIKVYEMLTEEQMAYYLYRLPESTLLAPPVSHFWGIDGDVNWYLEQARKT